MNGLNPACVESVIRKAKEGKLTTGQAEIHTGPEPSVEKIRFKIEERLETNNPIMTVKKLIILDTTVTLIKEIGDTNESKLQYT